MALPEQIYCYACGRMEKNDKFYMNYSDFEKQYHYGRCLMCKSKSKEISQQIMKKYSNYQLALIELCNIFHLPYIPEVGQKLEEYDKSPVNVNERDINHYFNYMKFATDSKENGGCGYTSDDPIWSNFTYNSWIKTYILKIAKGRNEGDEELFFELEKTWGRQDKLDDYLWLEERFHIYSDGETLTPAMSNTLHYLCLAELDVNKLRNDKADQKEITTAEKRVADYYQRLGMDGFKFNKNKSEEEKLIEDWAKIEEEIEPLDWIDDKLEDICHFRSDNDEIMRCLGNKVVGNRDYPTLSLEDISERKKKSKKINDIIR